MLIRGSVKSSQAQSYMGAHRNGGALCALRRDGPVRFVSRVAALLRQWNRYVGYRPRWLQIPLNDTSKRWVARHPMTPWVALGVARAASEQGREMDLTKLIV
jgi:hypothetical protein